MSYTVTVSVLYEKYNTFSTYVYGTAILSNETKLLTEQVKRNL